VWHRQQSLHAHSSAPRQNQGEHEKDEPDVPRGLAFSILRLVAALPIVRQFGELLLLIAQSPVRLPVEGEHRSGSRVAKGVCRSYMHKKHQEPSWGEELV
jgi:hypothetical protein